MELKKGFYKFSRTSYGEFKGHPEGYGYASYIFIGFKRKVYSSTPAYVEVLPFIYNEKQSKWEVGTWRREERLMRRDWKLQPLGKRTIIKLMINNSQVGKKFQQAIENFQGELLK